MVEDQWKPPQWAEDIFPALRSDVIWLHARWKLYTQLFGDARRVELLNRSAGSFFRQIQLVLTDDTILGVARLLDPAASFKGDANQTLEQLISRIPDDQATLRESLGAELDSLRVKCEPFRQHRNKRVAHRDLGVVVAAPGEGLTGLTHAAFREALSGLASIMNAFETGLGGSTWLYDEFIFDHGGDADHVAWLLAKADALDRLVKPEVLADIVRRSPYSDA